MASKFEYKKVCQFCGNEFLAQKSITKYCSDICANRGNKVEKRQERLQLESEAIRERNRQNLLVQENCRLPMPPPCSAFEAHRQNFQVLIDNSVNILNIVSLIRKQQKETVESQEADVHYFNFRLFKVRKTSFVIAMLTLLYLSSRYSV